MFSRGRQLVALSLKNGTSSASDDSSASPGTVCLAPTAVCVNETSAVSVLDSMPCDLGTTAASHDIANIRSSTATCFQTPSKSSSSITSLMAVRMPGFRISSHTTVVGTAKFANADSLTCRNMSACTSAPQPHQDYVKVKIMSRKDDEY